MQAGIDIGSVTTKCVILDQGRVCGRALVKTGVDPEASARQVLADALQQAGPASAAGLVLVATGYGRRLFSKAGRIVTEIAAAAQGAFAQSGQQAGLVLDVGGQDTKIIEVSPTGDVTDFLMNDKCAAGTGRFLELMAGILETDLDGLAGLALQSRSPVMINATCSVFAESEVVSLIAHATPKADIAAGVFRAIAERIAGMLRHFGRADRLFFCGGGARSPALQQALETVTGQKVAVLPDPQFVTAYGAARAAG